MGKQHLYKLNKNLWSAVGLPSPGEDGDGACLLCVIPHYYYSIMYKSV